MAAILTTHGLTKRYGNLLALNKLSIEVEKGTVYGLLGPNGSGKTTTLGIVLDVLNATAGSYQWFGRQPATESRKRIGAILETPNFYPYLSAVKNLKIVADIKGTGYEKIDETLRLVNLFERKKDAFKNYSLGMRQRLSLAAALLSSPEVLVLDEPTNGLDPEGIAEVRELIIQIAAQGKTIIIASHLLNEVEKVCTHVAVLKKGNLLAAGKVSEVLSEKELVEIGAGNLAQLKILLENHPEVTGITPEGNYFLVALNKKANPGALNEYLHSNGISATHLTLRKQNLESQFLELIKQPDAKAV